MNKRCPKCNLLNFTHAKECKRCSFELAEVPTVEVFTEKSTILKSRIFRRAMICFGVFIFTLAGFYISLIFSADALNSAEQNEIKKAIRILEEKGFDDEVFYLKYLTVFRANDNWLNASVEKENAYAATNFPFEIMTIYPDFFAYTLDDTERAAILLHEAQHLKGAGENEAYEYVWKNRQKLGWTKENYNYSIIWKSVRRQTKEMAPHLFICSLNEYNDCTE